MEKKYSDAFKAGLKFGLYLAAIYAIIVLAGIILNHTGAMVSYMDQLAQYNKDMFNQSYSNPGTPYVYTHPMPRPPLEYYIGLILTLLMYALLTVGFIGAGAYAMKKYGQAKYSLKDAAYMGTLAAIGTMVPIIVVMILSNIVNLIVNGAIMSSTFGSMFSAFNNMPGPALTIMPAVIACELICCCLPIGILVPVFLSCIGAIGYVLATGKLESRSPQP